MSVVVQKFGGSSLATHELREIAASRVLDVVRRGDTPVVVCSAMGRAPDPYATDSLAALLGPAPEGPNRDLLLACGEAIACAVFAELLCSLGRAGAGDDGPAGRASSPTMSSATPRSSTSIPRRCRRCSNAPSSPSSPDSKAARPTV